MGLDLKCFNIILWSKKKIKKNSFSSMHLNKEQMKIYLFKQQQNYRSNKSVI